MLTTRDAARELGVQSQTVLKAIYKRQLKAVKVGRDWQIDSGDFTRYKQTRKRPGNPGTLYNGHIKRPRPSYLVDGVSMRFYQDKFGFWMGRSITKEINGKYRQRSFRREDPRLIYQKIET